MDMYYAFTLYSRGGENGLQTFDEEKQNESTQWVALIVSSLGYESDVVI